ncbi:MAG: tetraacyldisaccharide 4'-kinase [Acidobacteriota bacterium]
MSSPLTPLAHLGSMAQDGLRTVVEAGLKIARGPVQQLPRPVISVGNVAMGGTGKTPVAAELTRLLCREGFLCSLLSRGYRGLRRHEPLVVSDLQRIHCGPVLAGDEPFLLARQLPGCPVIVGANRHEAGLAAMRLLEPHVKGPHIYVLDDGFQHHRLHRDVDIVLLDASDPWSGGRLWPWAGFRRGLREPLRALERARVIVLTRADRIESSQLEELAKEVARRAPERPIFAARQRLAGWSRVDRRELLPMDALDGARVLAFAGIARPERFFEDLEDLGLEVRSRRSFLDHHAFDRDDLASLLNEAEEIGATALVTTEKDAVRLPTPPPDRLPIRVLRSRASFDEPEQLMRCLLSMIPMTSDGQRR